MLAGEVRHGYAGLTNLVTATHAFKTVAYPGRPTSFPRGSPAQQCPASAATARLRLFGAKEKGKAGFNEDHQKKKRKFANAFLALSTGWHQGSYGRPHTPLEADAQDRAGTYTPLPHLHLFCLSARPLSCIHDGIWKAYANPLSEGVQPRVLTSVFGGCLQPPCPAACPLNISMRPADAVCRGNVQQCHHRPS